MINIKNCFAFLVVLNMVCVSYFSCGAHQADVNKQYNEPSLWTSVVREIWHSWQPIVGGAAFCGWTGLKIGQRYCEPHNANRLAAVLAVGGMAWFGGSQLFYDLGQAKSCKVERVQYYNQGYNQAIEDSMKFLFKSDDRTMPPVLTFLFVGRDEDRVAENAILQLVQDAPSMFDPARAQLIGAIRGRILKDQRSESANG